MKHFVKIAYLSFIFFALLFAIFCAKPDITDNLDLSDNISVTSRTTLDDYPMTTNDITVENGMLCFKDTGAYHRTIESLIKLSSDSVYVDNYLRSIGIIPGGPIPPNFDVATDPICQKFNARFAFFSLREYAEDTKSQLLANGVPYDSLPKFLIGSSVLRSLFNQYYEVKIGNLIYKMIDDVHTFIITGNDISLLPLLRAAPDPFAIGPIKNLALIDDWSHEDSILYKHIFEQSVLAAGCDFSFEFEKIENKTYRFTNSTRYYELNSNNANVYWIIKDANGTILSQTTTHSNSYTYTVPDNLPNSAFPLSATMQHVTPCIGTVSQNFVSAVCDNPIKITANSITAREIIDALDPLTFQFRIELGSLTGYNVTWNFGDGSPEVTISNGNHVTHNFPVNLGQNINIFNVCATVTKGACYAAACKKFDFGCGERKYSFEAKYDIPGKSYYYEVSMNIDKADKFRTVFVSKIIFGGDREKIKIKNLRATYFTPNPTSWLLGCILTQADDETQSGGIARDGWAATTFVQKVNRKYVRVRDDMFKVKFIIKFFDLDEQRDIDITDIVKIYKN